MTAFHVILKVLIQTNTEYDGTSNDAGSKAELHDAATDFTTKEITIDDRGDVSNIFTACLIESFRMCQLVLEPENGTPTKAKINNSGYWNHFLCAHKK